MKLKPNRLCFNSEVSMNALNKFSNLSLPVKASIAFLAVNIIQKGLSFLTTPIFTRLLDTAEYGQVATYLSLLEVVGIFAMFCLQGGIFNIGMVDYPNKRSEFCFSMLSLSNLITIVCLFIVIAFIGSFKHLTGLCNYMICLMFIYYMLQPAFGFWASRQRYEYKYRSLSAISLLLAICAPVSAIVCIYYGIFGDKVAERLIGFDAPLLLLSGYFYFSIAKKSSFKVDVSYWKQALSFNIVLIPHYVSTFILSSSDRIMIARLDSNSAAGIYSLGYSIGLVLMSLWIAINNSLVPYTYENCKAGSYEKISRATMNILMFFAACCVSLILVTPEFILFLAPPSYYQAIYVIPTIVGGLYFLAMYNIFANIVYYYKKPKYVMIGSVLSAGLNIVLNYYFIPIYGLYAAAYTTMICYIMQAAIDYWAMKKVLGCNIYPRKVLLTLCVVIIVISFIGIRLYDYIVLRYLMLALVFITIYRHRNNINLKAK